jgi:hypothetical protein
LQSENVAFGVLVALAFRNLNRGDRFGLLGAEIFQVHLELLELRGRVLQLRREAHDLRAVGFVSEVDETSL